MRPIFLLILIFTATLLFGQSRIYVDASATGANNGQSWADALADLHTALLTAQAGDEVWVATGIYLPTADASRDSFFSLPSGVRLFGGFAGTETDLSQRDDWEAQPTTLSGDIGVPGDSTDNSFTILYLDNPDSMTMVDGFRFEWGNANWVLPGEPALSHRKNGGAMYIMGEDGEAYPTIRNCHFEHNFARFGGAVYINGTNNGSVAPMFLNCIFERNTAFSDGGGVYRKGSSWAERTPDFGDCSFLNNYCGRWGGGLFFEDSETTDTLQVWNSKFIGNTKGLGAGMFLSIGRQDGSKVDVRRCDFKLNKGSFGAVFNISNIFTFSNTDFVQIEDSNISDNSGTGEGMIYLDGFGATDSARTIINNCVFSGNYQATLTGPPLLNVSMSDKGALSITNTVIRENKVGNLMSVFAAGKLSIDHCLVVDNKETTSSGFFDARNNYNVEVNNTVFYNNKYDPNQAAINLRATKITVRNSVFQHKRLFYLNDTSPTNPLLSEVEVFNSILSVDELISYDANLVQASTLITHSLMDGVNFDCQNPPQGVACGPGNLFNLDPLFRDTATNDYSLLPCSPLINAGSNAGAAGIQKDLAGNPRILGGTVDIGAYESAGLALSAVPQVQPSCLGASNGSISIALVEDGCEPYSYHWWPDVGTGPELNNLPPGSYLFTITDGSGRQILDTLEVAEAPKPQLNPFSTDVQCTNGLGGSISAGTSSGTAPYHYQWQPLAADTAMLNHLSPGAYALTVVDAQGCQDSAKASIALLGMLTPSIDGQSISCPGAADGWLSLTPSTGAAPFSWLWTGWPGTDAVAQPLGPGQYSVTVTDAYGCTASNTFPPMNDPAAISASLLVSDQSNLNMPNGSAIVTSTSGGTPFPGMPPYYQYTWSTNETGSSIAGLSAGTYTLQVTDSHGCTSIQAFEVQLMVGTAELEGAAFLLYPNPAADWLRVVLPAHAGKYQVELSDASGRVVRSQALPATAVDCQLDLRGLPGGSYLVRVLDAIGNSVFVGKLAKE